MRRATGTSVLQQSLEPGLAGLLFLPFRGGGLPPEATTTKTTTATTTKTTTKQQRYGSENEVIPEDGITETPKSFRTSEKALKTNTSKLSEMTTENLAGAKSY